jgi:hypothetical protein
MDHIERIITAVYHPDQDEWQIWTASSVEPPQLTLNGFWPVVPAAITKAFFDLWEALDRRPH